MEEAWSVEVCKRNRTNKETETCFSVLVVTICDAATVTVYSVSYLALICCLHHFGVVASGICLCCCWLCC
jgi:hypothetical protein